VIGPAEAEEPVRAAAGHSELRDRFLDLEADNVFVVELLASFILPRQILDLSLVILSVEIALEIALAEILTDDDDGPSEFPLRVLGFDAGDHLRVPAEVAKREVLVADDHF